MQAVRKRPVVISVFSIISLVSALFSFIMVFSPSVKAMGDWYPALFGLTVALRFMSLIGIWNMKQWGANLYIIAFFIDVILGVLNDNLNYIGAAYSVAFITLLLINYKKMDVNL